MPSTRFSTSRAGHHEVPASLASSSDFSSDSLMSRAKLSSSPTWNFLEKTRDQMPTRCKSAASSCISPRASGRWPFPTLGTTIPPRSTRISSPSKDSVIWRKESYALRSEEHTSELQSPDHLVCRLLLEKKNITNLLGVTDVHTEVAIGSAIFGGAYTLHAPFILLPAFPIARDSTAPHPLISGIPLAARK